MKQTIKTIVSIRRAIPNTRIALLEASPRPLPEEWTAVLRKSVNVFADYTRNTQLQQMHSKLGKLFDCVKSFMELSILLDFYQNPKVQHFFPDMKRIFKISGRYYLNEQFSIQRYTYEHANKFVFAPPVKSQFPLESVQIPLQYMSRLYSFDINLLPQMKSTLDQMMSYLLEQFNRGSYVDVEHLLYQFTPRSSISLLSPIGISGQLASTGQTVSD